MVHSVSVPLHSKCHHQIIYSKLNLEIEYLPPYIRKKEDYNWPTLFSRKKCTPKGGDF